MRYTIYEDPLTHRFAFVALPNGFVDGDKLPVAAIDRWFSSWADAIAALPDLLKREEDGEAESPGEPANSLDGRALRQKYGHH